MFNQTKNSPKYRLSIFSIYVSVCLWLIALPVFAKSEQAQPAQTITIERVLQLSVDGVINPAASDYLATALTKAQAEKFDAVLLLLNTPGGLLETTRTMVQQMLGSEIPIIVWVTPAGARAASAGMFITLSGHVAVMAPGTNIGAATPVEGQGENIEQTAGSDMAQKVMEDTLAFARSIAQVRQRPEQWMQQTITQAVSATSEEALAIKAIDFVATDRADLWQALAGRVITTSTGAKQLSTSNVEVVELEMSLGQKLMHLLAHPNIAYLLMLFGMLCIYFEISQPGGYIAGAIGAIALILAFMSFQVLPFRTGGVLLIFLAIVLFVVEMFVSSLGILAVGGFISFLVGSLVLFDTPGMDVAVDLPIVLGASLAFGSIMLFLGYLMIKSVRRKITTGRQAMIGLVGEALENLAPTGQVFVRGEIWQAVNQQPGKAIEKGQKVRVMAIDGLTVHVQAEP